MQQQITNIQTRGWKNDRNLRKCSLCNNNDLGDDEFHYIYRCSFLMRNAKIPRFSLKRREACSVIIYKKVQVGNDQEKAQSERNFHSKNRGEKKLN